MTTSSRLPDLDYLRGYAIVMVGLLHISDVAFGGTWIPAFIRGQLNLQAGVDIFFVISGFVISMTLRNLWSRSDHWVSVVLTFYTRRFFRLWPAAFTWLSAVVLLTVIFPGPPWNDMSTTLTRWALGSLYLSNFAEVSSTSILNHYWSLALEWQFYILLPLLLVSPPRWRVPLVAGLWIAWAIVRPGGAAWWLFRIDGLCAGVLLYFCHGAARGCGIPLPRGLAYIAALLLLLVCVRQYGGDPRWLAMLPAAAGAGLVWLGLLNNGYIPPLGGRHVGGWLGSRSYSLYLVHIPVVYFLVSLSDRLPVAVRLVLGEPVWRVSLFVLAWTMTLVAAELTYKFIEAPSHAFARSFQLSLGRQKLPAERGDEAAVLEGRTSSQNASHIDNVASR